MSITKTDIQVGKLINNPLYLGLNEENTQKRLFSYCNTESLTRSLVFLQAFAINNPDILEEHENPILFSISFLRDALGINITCGDINSDVNYYFHSHIKPTIKSYVLSIPQVEESIKENPRLLDLYDEINYMGTWDDLVRYLKVLGCINNWQELVNLVKEFFLIELTIDYKDSTYSRELENAIFISIIYGTNHIKDLNLFFYE